MATKFYSKTNANNARKVTCHFFGIYAMPKNYDGIPMDLFSIKGFNFADINKIFSSI